MQPSKAVVSEKRVFNNAKCTETEINVRKALLFGCFCSGYLVFTSPAPRPVVLKPSAFN